MNNQNRTSAIRLYQVLEKIKDGKTFGIQVASIFQMAKLDQNQNYTLAEQMKACLMLQELYLELLRDIDNSDMNEAERQHYVRMLNPIKNFVFNTAPQASTQKPKIEVLTLLTLCSTRLKADGIIDDAELEKIRESVSNMRETVLPLPKDSPLKVILLEMVRLCEDALNRYQIYGPEGLKRAFKQMLGEYASFMMFKEGELDNELEKEPKSKSALDNAKHTLVFLDKALSKVNEHRPLLEAASQFLLS